MATNKRVFTLRLSDQVFDKIGMLASSEHRSMTNYVEFVLLKHLEEVEKEMIRKALEKHNGRRKNAAADLKISERTLYRKIKEYNLE